MLPDARVCRNTNDDLWRASARPGRRSPQVLRLGRKAEEERGRDEVGRYRGMPSYVAIC